MLLTRRKHVHDRIIILIGEAWVHDTSFNLYQARKGTVMCLFVGVSLKLSLSTVSLLDFGTVPTHAGKRWHVVALWADLY